MTDVVDQTARDGVVRVEAAQSAHERECVIRWGQARDSMERLEKTLSGVVNRMWIAMGAVLSVALAVIGFLAAKLIG